MGPGDDGDHDDSFPDSLNSDEEDDSFPDSLSFFEESLADALEADINEKVGSMDEDE